MVARTVLTTITGSAPYQRLEVALVEDAHGRLVMLEPGEDGGRDIFHWAEKHIVGPARKIEGEHVERK